MKTYVLIVSKKFPKQFGKTLWKSAKPTFFDEKILSGKKIHTIRGSYKLWEKRIKEINEGKAFLSIRCWDGLPYRSKQSEIKVLTKVGIEKVKFIRKGNIICFGIIDKFVHGIYQMAHNDGLNMAQFNTWFADYDLKEEMAIIHFTDFRYDEIKNEGTFV